MSIGAVTELGAAGLEMGSKTLFDLLIVTFRLHDAMMLPALEKLGFIEVPTVNDLQGRSIPEGLVHRTEARRQSTLNRCHQPDPCAATQIVVALERIVQCALRGRMNGKDKRRKAGVETCFTFSTATLGSAIWPS